MSREMIDSGIEWIGEIPSSWKTARLKDVVAQEKNAIVDGPFGSAINTKDYVDEGIPLIRITNLINGKVDKESVVYITKEHAKRIERSKIKVGDIVVAKTGATVGKCAINKDIDYGILSSSCIKASISNEHIPEFYLHMMSTNQFREDLINACNGTTRDTINLKPFSTLKVPIPESNHEETLIASYLNTTITQLDSIINKTKSTIEDYKLLKQSIITEAVTKGLDKNVEMKDSGVEWIGKIPKHWNIMKIKHVVRIRDEKGEYDANRDCFIGLENIGSQSGKYIVTDTKYENGLNPIFKKDDILFGKLRPYLAKCIRTDFSGFCTSELLILKDFIGNKRFLQLYLLSPIFIDQVNSSTYGTKMPRANWNFIKELEIPIPPVEEQDNIEDYFDEKLEEIDNLIETKENLVIDLEVYKKSLIYEYVTGKKEIE